MKNLFLVHTEYHFMLAIQIISSFIDDTSDNTILFTFSKTRRSSINFSRKGNVNVVGIEAPLTATALRPYIDNNYENFYYFQNGDIRNRWLTWQLKKKDAVIHLVQDGMAAYCYNESSLKLPIIIKDTIDDYRALKKGNFPFTKMFITNKFRYGFNSATDKVMLTHPENFDNKKRGWDKIVANVPVLNEKSREVLWQFLPASNLSSSQDVILIINQPLWSDALFKADLEFINALANKFKGRKIFMKLHPLTNKKYCKIYSELEGIEIIESTVPVELMMQDLKNSIVISGYSTALISNSEPDMGNKYYYYFPVYKKTGDKAMQRKSIVVFSHIQVVDSVENIN